MNRLKRTVSISEGSIFSRLFIGSLWYKVYQFGILFYIADLLLSTQSGAPYYTWHMFVLFLSRGERYNMQCITEVIDF